MRSGLFKTAYLLAIITATAGWVWLPIHWLEFGRDYCSHNLRLGDAEASLMLGPILALLFVTARNGLLQSLSYYWLTIVAVRAVGTVVTASSFMQLVARPVTTGWVI